MDRRAIQTPYRHHKKSLSRNAPTLECPYQKQHAQGGKPNTLSIADKLFITLQYYREYRSFEHIAADSHCNRSTIYRTIRWVEETLSADPRFQLLDKAALETKESKTIAVDVTEHPIVRPKKTKKCITPARKSGTR
jgi:predicted DNA-binding protein YlxM (UPF0122 family)